MGPCEGSLRKHEPCMSGDVWGPRAAHSSAAHGQARPQLLPWIICDSWARRGVAQHLCGISFSEGGADNAVQEPKPAP